MKYEIGDKVKLKAGYNSDIVLTIRGIASPGLFYDTYGYWMKEIAWRCEESELEYLEEEKIKKNIEVLDPVENRWHILDLRKD